MKIEFKEFKVVTPSIYIISANEISLGEFRQLEDGFYNWFPSNFNGSCMSSWVLKEIYEKLESLNKDWQDKINNLT